MSNENNGWRERLHIFMLDYPHVFSMQMKAGVVHENVNKRWDKKLEHFIEQEIETQRIEAQIEILDRIFSEGMSHCDDDTCYVSQDFVIDKVKELKTKLK